MSDSSSRTMSAATGGSVDDGYRVNTGRIDSRLAEWLEREINDGRGFFWLPVFFGVGIVIYFSLPSEPSTIAVVGVALAAVVLASASRRHVGPFRLAIAITMVTAGTAAIKLRTDAVIAPKLPREMTAVVSGWVAKRETATQGGVRVTLRVAKIEGLSAGETPYAVRITIRAKNQAISVGEAIAVTARLRPPNGPVLPGGYDFARVAFYEGTGAVGFAYGAARAADLGPAPLAVRVLQPLERLRETIGERVAAVLRGDAGQVASALIIGDRGGISTATQESMRASGLGHILAISGLHMALIAGSAFWIIRALLALSPRLTLQYPIKKWSALGALLVATVYLGISGAHVATQRAYIMLSIMLLAVLVNRRAITLNNIALAAFIVLIIAPESLLTASFQMSFAATVALVAAFEELTAWSYRRPRLAERGGAGLIEKVWRYGAGLTLTSLVAGLATTPFAIYHFHRMAPLTLLANVLAMPALGVIVMPAAFVGVLLMPFGLDFLPLSVMNMGIGWIIAVAGWANDLTGNAGSVRSMPVLALFFLVFGFLWVALWRQPWRLLGVVPLALAVPIAVLAPRPDILVSPAGNAAAIRGPDGRLSVIAGPGSRFVVENWLRADADVRQADADGLSNRVTCDPFGCIAMVDDEAKLSVVFRPDAFAEDCHFADIVVSRFDAPSMCDGTAIVIDHGELAHHGAHAFYRLEDDALGHPRFRIATAYPAAGRPWMPAFSNGE